MPTMPVRDAVSTGRWMPAKVCCASASDRTSPCIPSVTGAGLAGAVPGVLPQCRACARIRSIRLESEGEVWVVSGITNVMTIRAARRSSRWPATCSSLKRPSACRSTAGSPDPSWHRDPRLVAWRSQPPIPAVLLCVRKGTAAAGGTESDRRGRRGAAPRCRGDGDPPLPPGGGADDTESSSQ